ncbi:MAG TPA: PepSY domain-containing protein [Thermoanaerobaculia bacterium]|nr:PepSY domain-containing protein [Thermoanaerobaculia bacterium]
MRSRATGRQRDAPGRERKRANGAARWLVAIHRWLGIVCGALVVAWFLSGFVMLWHGMPALEPGERLERLPVLDLEQARVEPADAAQRANVEAHELRIATLLSRGRTRPVYRFGSSRGVVTVLADDGSIFRGMGRADAAEVASRHLGGAAVDIGSHRRLEEPDQWTLQSRRLLPMHRFELRDETDRVVYVSDRTGEVVLVTDRSSRRWGWLGPVVHWVYFTPLRRHSALWLQAMIWASAAGVVLTSTGLAWGIWVLVRRRRLPHAGWLRWHHLAGLLFGLASVAWVLSGLLSLDPWDWHPGTAPTGEEHRAVRGGADLDLEAVTLERLRAARNAMADVEAPRELEVGRFGGETFVVVRSPAVDGQRHAAWLAEPTRTPAPLRERDELVAAARRALPAHQPVAADRLEHGDAYYYQRPYRGAARRPLPVLRVRFDDPAATALYLDPLTGSLLHREQRLTRLNRWLYHGLHSWDHPALLVRPGLRLGLMLAFLAGGLATATSAFVPGWRRLRASILGRRRRGTDGR